MGVQIDADGREISGPKAEKTGRYRAPNGVTYRVNAGEQIPPGWQPVEAASDGGPAKPKRPTGKARRGPQETK